MRNQSQQLRRSLRHLEREGFSHVFVLSSPAEVEAAVVQRQPIWSNRKHEHGPFDIIGDVHGCCDELHTLLQHLGYEITALPDAPESFGYRVHHAAGRKAVFLGDLVDRGPNTPGVLRLVMSMVAAGAALCVPGNHDMKLLRKLKGRNVQITHGLAASLEQLAAEPPAFVEQVMAFLDRLVSHYVLDDGKLVVAHAGMQETMQGVPLARCVRLPCMAKRPVKRMSLASLSAIMGGRISREGHGRLWPHGSRTHVAQSHHQH